MPNSRIMSATTPPATPTPIATALELEPDPPPFEPLPLSVPLGGTEVVNAVTNDDRDPSESVAIPVEKEVINVPVSLCGVWEAGVVGVGVVAALFWVFDAWLLFVSDAWLAVDLLRVLEVAVLGVGVVSETAGVLVELLVDEAEGVVDEHGAKRVATGTVMTCSVVSVTGTSTWTVAVAPAIVDSSTITLVPLVTVRVTTDASPTEMDWEVD